MRFLPQIPTKLLILLLGCLLFLPFLGNANLFDWDEVNFAESAREMLVSGNYLTVQINYLPFWEKPPLFFWLQAASFKMFGVNAYAARLPNAICGILTLLLLYKIGKSHFSKAFGILWVLVYTGSLLPHLYFKSGIIDPVFNLFIFLAVYHLLSLSFDSEFINPKVAKRQRSRSAFLSGVFIGLAVLTKGPVAILIQLAAGLAYFAITKGKKIFNRFEFMMWFIALVFTISAWYGALIYNTGFWIIREFIEYQIRLFSTPDAGHGGPFYYHFVVLLIGCFPASIFLFNSFRKYEKDSINQTIIKKWMIALLVIILVIFSIVETKIIHYSSMAYFPITFLATYVIHKMIKGDTRWRWFHLIPFLLIAGVLGVAMFLLPIIGLEPERITHLIKDKFTLANLQAQVVWYRWEAVYGGIYLLAVLFTIFFFVRKNTLAGISWTFVITAMALQCILTFFVPKIERYVQHSAVEMYTQIGEKDVYVNALYKSYAQYYFAKKNDRLEELPEFQRWLTLNGYEFDEMTSQKIDQLEREWHLSGNIDKPAYFVAKINKADNYIEKYGLIKLLEKNGYVLLKREKVIQ